MNCLHTPSPQPWPANPWLTELPRQRSAAPLAEPSSADRPTLVLLHASASSSRQWAALATSLQSRFQVHAIDLHGHGRQGAPAHGGTLSLHDDAALARQLLQAAGGGHLVGHSYGAAVALHLAAASPGLVHSLALYEPVVFRLLADHAAGSFAASEAFELGTRVWTLTGQGRHEEAAAYFIDYWSGHGNWQAMPIERRQATAERMPVIAQQFATLMREPLPAAALARLHMPLLCLHGTRTTAAALQMAALLKALLPQGSRHEALEGLGHMAPVTHSLPITARLVQFLTEEAPRQRTVPLAQAA